MARTPAVLLCIALSACGRLSDGAAEAVVRTYNEKVIEAYRTSDVQLVVGLVGDEELKKLTGLIGVRQDADLFLDSELVRFMVTGIERPGKEVHVLTQEHWSYRDRHVGDGKQVGEASEDDYQMRYVLKAGPSGWLVERIEFVTAPSVGRKQAPLGADRGHGAQPSLGGLVDGGAP